MTKHSLLILIISMLVFGNARGPTDTLRQIIKTVFFEKKVYDRIFDEYKSDFRRRYISLPNGKYVCITPDTTFQRFYPEVLEDLNYSLPHFGIIATIPFIKEPNGTIYIKNNLGEDSLIRRRIVFKKISIQEEKATLIFHSASQAIKGKVLRSDDFTVFCNLKHTKSGWVIKSLKIKNGSDKESYIKE